MKILLDECTPRIVQRRLPKLDISTVQQVGWGGVKNGELLARAEGRFDVLVTADRNLQSQQHITGRRLAVIVLPSNRVPDVVAVLAALEVALQAIQPGTVVELPPAR